MPSKVEPRTAQTRPDSDLGVWRASKRAELISARLAVPAGDRTALAAEVADELDQIIQPGPGKIISLYWPFRGELDLRGWMRAANDMGAAIALPVVLAKAQPLIFRPWTPGCRMERGVWNIPIPAEGGAIVPNVVIAPLVGYDPGCYRLGYGGGFFDRTLAAMAVPPLVIGVGHPSGALSSIRPQAYDIPMDVVITGKGRTLRRAEQ